MISFHPRERGGSDEEAEKGQTVILAMILERPCLSTL
jgi:hypothetical protein